MPVKVDELGCDVLVATTRKWARGPRGTALFWLDQARSEQGMLPLPRALEPNDRNTANLLGLGAALNVIEKTTEIGTHSAIAALNTLARKEVAQLGLSCLSTPENGTGCLTISIPENSADAIRQAFAAARYIVKWPDHASDEPFSGFQMPGYRSVRIAAHVYNTPGSDHAHV